MIWNDQLAGHSSIRVHINWGEPVRCGRFQVEKSEERVLQTIEQVQDNVRKTYAQSGSLWMQVEVNGIKMVNNYDWTKDWVCSTFYVIMVKVLTSIHC